jgi:Fic family protein
MGIYELEPMLPELGSIGAEALEAKAATVWSDADHLGQHLVPDTMRAVAEMLRTVNCYYSNLIEGHDTHPVTIERAMRAEYAMDAPMHALQLEARAHIAMQKSLEARLDAERALNVVTQDVLCWIHTGVYHGLPEDLRRLSDRSGALTHILVPGAIRDYDVEVGQHLAPPHQEIDALLGRCADVYAPARFTGPAGLVAAAAAHHRVLWVHPFGDGNGRVTRLMTDGYLRAIGVGGHGLWTPVRGLARRRVDYKRYLAAADDSRRSDLDGRGARSLQALVEWCHFFLEVCDDQVRYMAGLLQVDELVRRTRAYGTLRAGGLAPDHHGRTDAASRWRPEAVALLEDLVYRGEMSRAEVHRRSPFNERTTQRVLAAFEAEQFITSASRMAPIQLRIPAHAAPYLFPGLYALPPEALDAPVVR